MKLADLQAQFQSAILDGGDGVLAHIPNSPKESKETLFGVYRNAYVLRLIGILEHDFERLHTYAGDERFDELARAFIAANPSHTPNARWYGQELPDFIARHPETAGYPALTAIAKLEGTLNDVFDIDDAPVLMLSELAAFAPGDWAELTFLSHPSVRRMNSGINLTELWTALADKKTPPTVRTLDAPEHIILWRQDVMPKLRVLAPEEAMMWDEAAKGVPFGVLCEMLATFDNPDEAPLRAAQYLKGWIEMGLLQSAAIKKKKSAKSKRTPVV